MSALGKDLEREEMLDNLYITFELCPQHVIDEVFPTCDLKIFFLKFKLFLFGFLEFLQYEILEITVMFLKL